MRFRHAQIAYTVAIVAGYVAVAYGIERNVGPGTDMHTVLLVLGFLAILYIWFGKPHDDDS